MYLYSLPRILHPPPQHRAKDHLNILDERIIPIIIAIQTHLVGIDDRVVVLHRYILWVADVNFFLFLGNILRFYADLAEKILRFHAYFTKKILRFYADLAKKILRFYDKKKLNY